MISSRPSPLLYFTASPLQTPFFLSFLAVAGRTRGVPQGEKGKQKNLPPSTRGAEAEKKVFRRATFSSPEFLDKKNVFFVYA